MSKALESRISFTEDDLTRPTASAKYPLGLEISIVDSATKTVKRFQYVYAAAAALVQYQPYLLRHAFTAGKEFTADAPATLASPVNRVLVPQVAFTSGYYGFAQYQGNAKVKIDAETYAVGDYLEVINTGTTAVVDGTSGATARSDKDFAISGAAGTTATAISVVLLGDKCQVAAS